MKKIVLHATLPIILTMATPLVLADADDCFEGWYTGLSIGGAFRTGHGTSDGTFNSDLNGGANTARLNTNLQYDLNENSALGVLSGGYGTVWCDTYYGGVEGFISLSKYHRKSPIETNSLNATSGGAPVTLNYNNSLESKLNSIEFGLDLRPGYILCPDTLLYGRIGVAYNRISIDGNASTSYRNDRDGEGGDGDFGADVLSDEKKRAVLRLGLGLERRFCDCWSLRADYIYSYYGRVRTSGSARTTGTVAGVPFVTNASASNKVTLSSNEIMLGIFYYW